MTGPVRPTGLLRPARVTPDPAPAQGSPMAGQPSMEEMLQMLMLLLMGQGGAGQPQAAAPVTPPMNGGGP